MEWPHCQPAPSLDKQLKRITGSYGVLAIKVGAKVLPFPPPKKKRDYHHPPYSPALNNNNNKNKTPENKFYRKNAALSPPPQTLPESKKWLKKISEKNDVSQLHLPKLIKTKVLRSRSQCPPNWTTSTLLSPNSSSHLPNRKLSISQQGNNKILFQIFH